MRSIGSVSFSLPGWELIQDHEALRLWTLDEHNACSLTFFPEPDPLEFDYGNTTALHNYGRQIAAAQQGCILEAGFVKLDGWDAIRAVYKYPLKPHGMRFIGSYTLYVDTVAYSLVLEFQEHGLIGERETAVALELGIPSPNPTLTQKLFAAFQGKDITWFQDPYNPRIRTPTMRCLADDEKWDERFPDHPLTRLRATLQAIEDSFQVS